jgi:hypothetical protein
MSAVGEELIKEINKTARRGKYLPSENAPVKFGEELMGMMLRQVYISKDRDNVHLAVGVGGDIGAFSLIKRSSDRYYWVTDRTLKPPLTRLAVRSGAGILLAEAQEGRVPGPFHSVQFEEGNAIAGAMLDLLNAAKPDSVSRSLTPIPIPELAAETQSV